MPDSQVQGTVRALFLYEVCEEINLEELRRLIGAQPIGRGIAKHPAPEYVGFVRPPVIETLEPLQTHQGLTEVSLKFYEYGVVSLIWSFPFSGTWQELTQLSANISDSNFENRAVEIIRQRLDRASSALQKRYTNWLNEDYYTLHLHSIPGHPQASELLKNQRSQIAQIVRGETKALSEGEIAEVLQSSISYYPDDLVVIGWNAAFIYDTPAGAEPVIQLLEYANSQLLEFRHYDELLTRELDVAYNAFKKGGGIFRRWRLARSSSRLQATAVEVTELAERADNAIKFLSDMFSARLYRIAAARVGVLDYKNLVNFKLRTAEELYRFTHDEYHQGRAFVLELMVVIILIIELVFLFRGIA